MFLLILSLYMYKWTLSSHVSFRTIQYYLVSYYKDINILISSTYFLFTTIFYTTLYAAYLLISRFYSDPLQIFTFYFISTIYQYLRLQIFTTPVSIAASIINPINKRIGLVQKGKKKSAQIADSTTKAPVQSGTILYNLLTANIRQAEV